MVNDLDNALMESAKLGLHLKGWKREAVEIFLITSWLVSTVKNLNFLQFISSDNLGIGIKPIFLILCKQYANF